MKLKTAADVIEVVRRRGLQIGIVAGPPMMPVIIRPERINPNLVTPALLGALKAWRLEIIEQVQRERGSNGER